MEIILLTNLAFSVVGFVFIFRMWREVKERRDYYGEHFAIPKGEDMSNGESLQVQAQAPAASVQVPGVPQMSMDQLTALVVNELAKQNIGEVQQQQVQQQPTMSEGDLQKLIANVAEQYGGGR